MAKLTAADLPAVARQLQLAVRELIRLADQCAGCGGKGYRLDEFQVFTLTDDPRRLLSPQAKRMRLINVTGGPVVHPCQVSAINVRRPCWDCWPTWQVIKSAGGFL